jgi:hypothetical protein
VKILGHGSARFRDKERLAIEHETEQRLLWDPCCVVGSQLPELIDTQWQSVIDFEEMEPHPVVMGSDREPT